MPSLYEMEIEKLKGVGEKRGRLYRKLGAPTAGDLLRMYPRGGAGHCAAKALGNQDTGRDDPVQNPGDRWGGGFAAYLF